jgi:predicted transport protein
MEIFQIRNSELLPIREKKVDLERDIQRLTEANLQRVFGLELIRSEFALHQFRIDTLGFDSENSSFVIIEYKRDRSFSVIDQGYSYLALMLNNKADFILEFNEQKDSSLKRDDVDWTQSRVIFVANSFTSYQQNAINFRDLPIELWEVKVFDNSTIGYNQLVSPESTESIKTVSKSKTIQKVNTEVKVYTLGDHLANINPEIKTLFEELRGRVLSLDSNIEERPKKKYIGYRSKNAFLYIKVQKGQLKVWLMPNKSDLDDPKDFCRDVRAIGHHGGGQSEVVLNNSQDLNYVMGLVEQSYRSVA